MLYHILYPLRDIFTVFNLFKYITFRAAGAAISAFAISIIFGPAVINKLKELKIGQVIRKPEESAPLYDLHRTKENTPTMGGILILFSVLSAVLLWANLTNKYILLAVFISVWLGILGFIDDLIKLKKKHSKGLAKMSKLSGQVILGLIVGAILFIDSNFSTKLDLPFLKKTALDLGVFYIGFAMLVIVASSNAVNLTDGLDGLAIGCVIMVAISYSALSYITGNIKFSEYLLVPYISGAGELTIFCASIIGAGLGFLWFNSYPATVFMGDIGSLALGGSLGAIAVFIKKELLLIIVGGIFVVEALSVILQVLSFRLSGKRIFKIAPLHHHFQLLGWSESKVIIRFWIVAILLSLFTLVTLKLR